MQVSATMQRRWTLTSEPLLDVRQYAMTVVAVASEPLPKFARTCKQQKRP
jgi:hypothetical protein